MVVKIELPNEIWVNIYKYMNWWDLFIMRQVNKNHRYKINQYDNNLIKFINELKKYENFNVKDYLLYIFHRYSFDSYKISSMIPHIGSKNIIGQLCEYFFEWKINNNNSQMITNPKKYYNEYCNQLKYFSKYDIFDYISIDEISYLLPLMVVGGEDFGKFLLNFLQKAKKSQFHYTYGDIVNIIYLACGMIKHIFINYSINKYNEYIPYSNNNISEFSEEIYKNQNVDYLFEILKTNNYDYRVNLIYDIVKYIGIYYIPINDLTIYIEWYRKILIDYDNNNLGNIKHNNFRNGYIDEEAYLYSSTYYNADIDTINNKLLEIFDWEFYYKWRNEMIINSYDLYYKYKNINHKNLNDEILKIINQEIDKDPDKVESLDITSKFLKNINIPHYKNNDNLLVGFI